MIEFKQIIGHVTKIRKDHGKLYFTIIDFRNVTKLFDDKDFDGDPIVIKPVTGDIPSEEEEPEDGGEGDEKPGDDFSGGLMGIPPLTVEEKSMTSHLSIT